MMVTILLKIFFTGVAWLIFGSLVSTIYWDHDVKKMPTWWKIGYGLPLILIFIAFFVTLFITIWTL